MRLSYFFTTGDAPGGILAASFPFRRFSVLWLLYAIHPDGKGAQGTGGVHKSRQERGAGHRIPRATHAVKLDRRLRWGAEGQDFRRGKRSEERRGGEEG